MRVEHTKTHNILKHEWNVGEGNYKNSSHFKRYENVLVTDAELVLVEASGEGNTILVNQLWVKPILISRTEKIEIGDLFYYTKYKIIEQAEKNDSSIECFKILALPEHFSPQQLQDIVDGKLKEAKYLVECTFTMIVDSIGSGIEYSIKFNPYITIYNIEEKMYTKQDLINYIQMYELSRFDWSKDRVRGIEIADKWCKQNIKD